MVFKNRRLPTRGRLLNERGQMLALLLTLLGILFWICAAAKGLV